jgi:drug/metabolite transporter (DMT)-like permease
MSSVSSPTSPSSPSSPVLPLTEEKPEPASSGRSLHPAFYIASWIFFSNLTIIFNKWLLDTAGFRYPVILTCWHLVFATVATQLLARTTSLLDGRHKVRMTGRIYLRAVVPIGVLYSGSLVFSNMTYLYLNVAFIQMLKSAAPVAVLFTSWIWRVEEPSRRKFYNVMVIVLGVGLASLGEIQFSWVGFMFQLGGIVFEAMRLVMIQVMLSEDGQKMDPLVSLYYYAPVCAAMNIFVALFTEASTFKVSTLLETGFGILLLNATVAFLLNVSSVFLIGKTSGLVMTLTGILKNILLVVASVMIWATQITGLQILGYAIALGGLVYYSLGWNTIVEKASEISLWFGAVTGTSGSYTLLDDARVTMTTRKAVIVGAVTAVATVTLIGLFIVHHVPADVVDVPE